MKNYLILTIAVLLLLPALIGGLNAFLNPNAPPWNPMQLAEGEIELMYLLDWEGDYILVDARTSENYGVDHMPEAINLNAGEFDAQILNLLDIWSPDYSIIVYCDSRQCGASEEIANRLREDFQMEKVFVLKGGWESWLSASAGIRSRLGGGQ